MKKSAGFVLGAVAVILLIILDRITKNLAVVHLKGQEDFVLIKDVFVLHYLENQGAAFGIMQEKQMLFYIATIVILAVIVYFYWKLPTERRFFPLHVIAVLVIAGAIGNFIDRVTNKYVVDFFYFRLINFPVFNVADIYVTGGAIAFIVLLIFYYKETDFNQIWNKNKKCDQEPKPGTRNENQE
ncbi:MAG: signal peptidase II [Eubacterium sp.]|nr:signal peptidase II [Eubacterium sp.]